jgi:hypothetical protein
MYLWVGLLRLGFIPKHNKNDAGPDAIFDIEEQQMVIEAVAWEMKEFACFTI